MAGNDGLSNRVKTGIYGLDPLLDGGLKRNSVSLVIGAPGTGKTTCATQFLMKGLKEGVEAIHITLDESKDQIIKEAKALGFEDIEEFADTEQLIFMEAAGSDFYDFIQEELPDLIAEWEGSSNARIVIDPLTPVIWSIKEKYHKREVLSSLFNQTKKIGTIMCTLEEHGNSEALNDTDVFLPMYLADSALRLSSVGLGFSISQMAKVVKMRGSWHSSTSHPYQIIQGMGLVITPLRATEKNIYGVKEADFAKLKMKIKNLPASEQHILMARARKVANSDLGTLKFNDVVEYLLADFESE